MSFKKATKKNSYLRMALMGISGSGKTYTSLRIAECFAQKEHSRVALIDTERGSASKYADEFDFDCMELEDMNPERYIRAIQDAAKAGYKVLIIDSLSHAWNGRNGALELVDKAAKRTSSGNSFTAWRDVTPLHNHMIDEILRFPGHVLVTMRSKKAYVIEENEKGKKTPKMIGMEPIQRDGVEYEFDVVGDMNLNNELCISKSRCSKLNGEVIARPGQDVASVLFDWVRASNDGPPSSGSFVPSAPTKPERFASEEEEMHVKRSLAELHATTAEEGLLLWAEEGKARIKSYSDHARTVLRDAYKKKKQSLVHEQETVEMEPISDHAMGPESSAA